MTLFCKSYDLPITRHISKNPENLRFSPVFTQRIPGNLMISPGF